MEDCTIHNNSSRNLDHLSQMIQHFFPYAQEKLGFFKPVMVSFQSDEENANKLLGKTAHYNPDDFSIAVYVDGRHPKDILRSFSHELVHHAQNCNGDFESTEELGPGYAQDNEAMRNAELDAYKRGNIIFRDFEDLIKKGDIAIEIDFESAGEPKMSLKEWKSDELNGLLMEKWGFKVQKEEKEIFAPNHYCAHHVRENISGLEGHCIDHNWNERLQEVTEYDVDFGNNDIRTLRVDELTILKASLAEEHSHPVARHEDESEGCPPVSLAGRIDRTDVANKVPPEWLKEDKKSEGAAAAEEFIDASTGRSTQEPEPEAPEAATEEAAAAEMRARVAAERARTERVKKQGAESYGRGEGRAAGKRRVRGGQKAEKKPLVQGENGTEKPEGQTEGLSEDDRLDELLPGWLGGKDWKAGKQTGTMPKNPKGPDNPKELEATTGTGTDVVSTVQDANRKQQSRADQYAAIADDTGGRKEDKKELEELTRWHDLAGLDEQTPPKMPTDPIPEPTMPTGGAPVPTPPAAPAEEPAPASAIVARREDRPRRRNQQENITLDEARDVARRIFEKLSESDELSEGWLDRLARGIQAGEGSEDRRSSTRAYAKGGGGKVVRGGAHGQRAKDYALMGLDPSQAPVDVEREMSQEEWNAIMNASDDASGGGRVVRGGSQSERAKAAERQGMDISTTPSAVGVQQQQQDKREKARRKRRPPIPPELDPGRPAGSIDVRMPGGGRRVIPEDLVNKILKKLIKEIK